MARAETETWKCPNRCGWFRTWSLDQAKADLIIPHPEYGNIRSIDAARRDVALHNCVAYLNAMERLNGSNSDGAEAGDAFPQRQAS